MALPPVRTSFDAPLPPYLPSDDASPRETIEAIREGLPAEAFDWLKEELHLTAAELAEVVHISPRTISRRKKEGRLQPDESDRILRLVRLLQRATDVFGSPDDAREWMQEPNFALGDDTPLQFADTEPGARRVERLLGQIEHGIIT
jgi:putative toxin-antitoxin system antitoxin component (TIGR02293 family)